MGTDWLFGPRLRYQERIAPAPGPIPLETRPLLLDIDTVIDTAELIRMRIDGGHFGREDVELTELDFLAGPRAVEAEELPNLSAHDHGRLTLFGRMGPNQTGHFSVSFEALGTPAIQVYLHGSDEASESLQIEIAEAILANGHPMIQWHRFAYLLPFTLVAAALAALIWATASGPVGPAVQVFAWIVLVAMAAGATVGSMYIGRWARTVKRGHRIRDESRAQTRARRTDTKANIKVAIVTVVLTAPATLLVAWLTGILNL
jgi:hypothetical protein